VTVISDRVEYDTRYALMPIFPDWIKQGGLAPSGLSLNQLTGDIAALASGLKRR
jgi:hypothetical protein